MTVKEIKYQFMVYRNGIVADTLRRSGMPYNVIFGLQIPQLGLIAREASSSSTETELSVLANALWEDRTVRESRLLAPYLFNRKEITEDKALKLAEDVQTVEEADILCFRLLRYLTFAPALAKKLKESTAEKANYCGRALERNLEAMQ